MEKLWNFFSGDLYEPWKKKKEVKNDHYASLIRLIFMDITNKGNRYTRGEVLSMQGCQVLLLCTIVSDILGQNNFLNLGEYEFHNLYHLKWVHPCNYVLQSLEAFTN